MFHTQREQLVPKPRLTRECIRSKLLLGCPHPGGQGKRYKSLLVSRFNIKNPARGIIIQPTTPPPPTLTLILPAHTYPPVHLPKPTQPPENIPLFSSRSCAIFALPPMGILCEDWRQRPRRCGLLVSRHVSMGFLQLVYDPSGRPLEISPPDTPSRSLLIWAVPLLEEEKSTDSRAQVLIHYGQARLAFLGPAEYFHHKRAMGESPG